MMPYVFDFDYTYSPDWSPNGCNIKPWFLFDAPEGNRESTWESLLSYRQEKVEFIRRQLEGVNRKEALKRMMHHIWKGAGSDQECLNRVVHFVQRMIIHPPVEQPMEQSAVYTFRRDCRQLTNHAPAYEEDLESPWVIQAYEEAMQSGYPHLGVWCNPLGHRLTGDWGLGGMITDALELLLLHEGRCGHQACVVVQLAQAAGWRARLVQVYHHRLAEVLIEGNWAMADPDLWEAGFIGNDQNDRPVDVLWCAQNPDYLDSHWKIRTWSQQNYSWHFRQLE